MPAPTAIANAAKRRNWIVSLIGRSLEDRGYPPSHVELATALEVSPRQVAKDLAVLERDGRITHTPRVARSLRVVTG